MSVSGEMRQVSGGPAVVTLQGGLGRADEKPSLDEVVRRIDEISSLPHVALRVLEVANDPRAGAADLKEVMEVDVALSARVLRCVNSSAYAVRTKVTNLQQAIAYLGLKQVRNLAMAIGVSQMFREDKAIGPYRRSQLWRHLVSVGVCARLIAMRLRYKAFEDVFLAGLLHDIGLVLEDQYAHRQFVAILENLDLDKTLAENEHRFLLFDHARLGDRVGEQWKFPDSIRDAIRHHHAPEACRGEGAEVVRYVEMANLICTLKGIPSVGAKLVKVSKATLSALALGKDDLMVIAQDLDRELAQNAELLGMGSP